MAKDYAKPFYNSGAWKKTQAAYMASQNYICEQCGGVACVVHHIRHIAPENIIDPSITLDWLNLKALCADCHAMEHHGKQARSNGVAFDSQGNLLKQPNVFLVCGSPGSGKSFYVSQQKKRDDLVIDIDLICAALMGEPDNIYLDHEPILSVALEVRAALFNIIAARRGQWRRAYVITATADKAEITAISNEINAKIVIIDTPLETCIERINSDQRRAGKVDRFINLAKIWHETYHNSPPIIGL